MRWGEDDKCFCRVDWSLGAFYNRFINYKIDLGEPELYNDWETFYGYADDENVWTNDEAGIHNIFQLLSSKALSDGYQRSGLRQRAASLVRTGTSGIQRCTKITLSLSKTEVHFGQGT